jgi:hypothetical protein
MEARLDAINRCDFTKSWKSACHVNAAVYPVLMVKVVTEPSKLQL